MCCLSHANGRAESNAAVDRNAAIVAGGSGCIEPRQTGGQDEKMDRGLGEWRRWVVDDQKRKKMIVVFYEGTQYAWA